jgi:hypothetical protein
MPAYSGGNRWVGIVALRPPTVPPPLHKMARDRMKARTRPKSYIDIDGRRVSRDQAQQALALLGEVLGAHADLPRQAQCFALARSLRVDPTRYPIWPRWARNAVLAYADDPQHFTSPRAYDLKAWALSSSRPQAPGPGKQTDAPRRHVRTTASRSLTASANAVPIHVTRSADSVNVVPQVLLDPGGAFDDLPLDPGLAKAQPPRRPRPGRALGRTRRRPRRRG